MNKRGMTLIEMLGALVLISLMMTVTLLFLVGFARRDDQMQELAQQQQIRPELLALLEQDINHATDIEINDDHLLISTYHQIDSRDFASKHLRSSIRWDIRQIEDRPWLIREQQSEGSAALITPVAVDIIKLNLSKAGITENADLPGTQTRYELTLTTNEKLEQHYQFLHLQ